MDTRHPFARIRFAVTLTPILLLWTLPASAQTVTPMVGSQVTDNQQIQNAAQAAEAAATAAAVGKENYRGASGSIATLLISSDTLICSSWIISFRVKYREMSVAASRGADTAELHALQKMQELMALVESNCDDVLHPPHPPEGEEGEDGQKDSDVDAPSYAYPACPQCEDLIQARNRRKYEYERDQYLLNRAMRETDRVESIWNNPNLSPGEKELLAAGTLEEVSEVETELWYKVYDGEEALERAQRRVEECLQRCFEVGKRTSFFRENATTIGIAGAAAGAGIVFAGRGGGASEAAGGPAAVTVGAADGEAIGTTASYMQCGGRYSSFWNVESDPGQHREFVGMPNAMFFDVAIASISITAPAPFVEVNGDIAEDGSFEATGMGTAAGFPSVSVRMTGTVTRCTDVAGTLRATYTMGVNRELPGGESISYDVNASK